MLYMTCHLGDGLAVAGHHDCLTFLLERSVYLSCVTLNKYARSIDGSLTKLLYLRPGYEPYLNLDEKIDS